MIEVLRGTLKFVCSKNSHSQDSNHPDDLFQSKKSFCSPFPFLPYSALTFRPCSPSISHIIPVYPLSPKNIFCTNLFNGQFLACSFSCGCGIATAIALKQFGGTSNFPALSGQMFWKPAPLLIFKWTPGESIANWYILSYSDKFKPSVDKPTRFPSKQTVNMPVIFTQRSKVMKRSVEIFPLFLLTNRFPSFCHVTMK